MKLRKTLITLKILLKQLLNSLFKQMSLLSITFYLYNIKKSDYIFNMNEKIKIALAQLNPLVGDVSGNVDKLLKIRSELKNDVDLLVAPELYISGYPIDDLVLREDFLNLVES